MAEEKSFPKLKRSGTRTAPGPPPRAPTAGPGPVRPTPDWKDYQERAADFFRSLGCDAITDCEVVGVRAKHYADVRVTFTRFGVGQLWVVECKWWRYAIPKEKVLALQSIVQDVGAYKGFLLSESGFQAGAVRAAGSTNVVLTNLEILHADAATELAALSIDDALRRYEDARLKLLNLTVDRERWQDARGGGGMVLGPPRYTEILGRLSILEDSLRSARRGRFPVVLDVDAPKPSRMTSETSELLSFADAYLQTVHGYLETHKDFARTVRT